MIGETLSHYKIIEKLGEGGMGIVYLAQDTQLDRQVAIKSLPQEIASISDERKRFELEAKAAAALNHPNVATVYSVENIEDDMYIVMEYIKGRELKEVVGATGPVARTEKLEIEKVLEIAIQIARGLEIAHESDIIHRDIKSANIFITKRNEIKILDLPSNCETNCLIMSKIINIFYRIIFTIFSNFFT